MIEIAKEKRALYFGFGYGGHGLRSWPRGEDYFSEHPAGFPWDDGLLDSGLLRNREVPDIPDGRVHWVGGGNPFWHGFFWWDRSGDPRGACNSGFYVQGFPRAEPQAALDYACEQWPKVVARQKFPLVLVHLPEQARFVDKAKLIRACQVPREVIDASHTLRADAMLARLQDCRDAGIDAGIGDYVEILCGQTWRVAYVVEKT